jgi:hypothetical protein
VPTNTEELLVSLSVLPFHCSKQKFDCYCSGMRRAHSRMVAEDAEQQDNDPTATRASAAGVPSLVASIVAEYELNRREERNYQRRRQRVVIPSMRGIARKYFLHPHAFVYRIIDEIF